MHFDNNKDFECLMLDFGLCMNYLLLDYHIHLEGYDSWVSVVEEFDMEEVSALVIFVH